MEKKQHVTHRKQQSVSGFCKDRQVERQTDRQTETEKYNNELIIEKGALKIQNVRWQAHSFPIGLIPRTHEFYSAQRLDLFAWCVRLSRLLVGFRTHFKSLHFHSFIHSFGPEFKGLENTGLETDVGHFPKHTAHAGLYGWRPALTLEEKGRNRRAPAGCVYYTRTRLLRHNERIIQRQTDTATDRQTDRRRNRRSQYFRWEGILGVFFVFGSGVLRGWGVGKD